MLLLTCKMNFKAARSTIRMRFRDGWELPFLFLNFQQPLYSGGGGGLDLWKDGLEVCKHIDQQKNSRGYWQSITVKARSL